MVKNTQAERRRALKDVMHTTRGDMTAEDMLRSEQGDPEQIAAEYGAYLKGAFLKANIKPPEEDGE
jgi:hypothetical protein